MAKQTEEQKQAIIRRKALQGIYGLGGDRGGRALADEFAPKGFLGRTDTELAQFKPGLEGYTSSEYQAQREQMQAGLNSQYATGASQLAKAQARGKVYGAAGAAQQANLIQNTQNSKDQLDQQLMVKNIDERQKRLNEFYGMQRAAENFNTGNLATETSTRINAYTGGAGQALMNANNRASQDLYQRALDALYGKPAQPVGKPVKPKTKPKPKVTGNMTP